VERARLQTELESRRQTVESQRAPVLRDGSQDSGALPGRSSVRDERATPPRESRGETRVPVRSAAASPAAVAAAATGQGVKKSGTGGNAFRVTLGYGQPASGLPCCFQPPEPRPSRNLRTPLTTPRKRLHYAAVSGHGVHLASCSAGWARLLTESAVPGVMI